MSCKPTRGRDRLGVSTSMAHYGVDGGDLLNIKQSLTGNQHR
jgi:hypothetical protein